jgi:GMP synthase (glutamine-hydrolysing)
VICGLSGGVGLARSPPSCCTEAIGDQLTCIFVDNGLLRTGEAEQVERTVPRPLQHHRSCTVDAQRAVPRRARRRHRSRRRSARSSAATFIDVFEEAGASEVGGLPTSSRRARSIPT